MAHLHQKYPLYGSGKRERFIGNAITLAIGFLMVMLASFPNAWAGEKTMDQLLEEARAAVKSLSISEVRAIAEGNEKAVLLDIRDMKEFIMDHIKGAENMSRAVGLSPRILKHYMRKKVSDKLSKIIVYCEFDTKAPLAVKSMNEIGYANAVYMKGGLKAWKEAGYPLEKM